MDRGLLKGDVKGFNWIDIIRFICIASLSRVISDGIPKRTIVVRTGEESWFDDRRVLAHCAKQSSYRVWSHSRTQADWEEYRVVRRHAQPVYENTERAFTERSKSLLTNAPNPLKWWSTIRMAVFFLCEL